MDNRMYDPQFESLKVFWEAQEKRLALLSGMTITDEILRQTAAFGDCEIAGFEKLMKAQKTLAGLLERSSAAQAGAPKGVYNPVIDDLDLSDPRTVRRFEIHSEERVGVRPGESMIPTFGIALLLGKRDAHTDAMAEFFAGKGLTVKRLERNLTEEEAQAFIADTAKEGPITAMAFAANAYDSQNQDLCGDARLTQLRSFVEAGNRKVLHPDLLKLSGNGHRPVPIGVGLHHTQIAAARRKAAAQLIHIMFQITQADLRPSPFCLSFHFCRPLSLHL